MAFAESRLFYDFDGGGASFEANPDYFVGGITPLEKSEKLREQLPLQLPDSLPSPELTDNAALVLKGRCLMEGETPEGMLRRIAGAVARAEELYTDEEDKGERMNEVAERFYRVMADLEFLPNSPTLINAGRPDSSGQLSACFVLPVGDSMPEIFNALGTSALIHQSGGGTGFSFSRLREAEATVRTTGGRASGPVSFMRVFDVAIGAVKEGGRGRGAGMAVLRYDHPDIWAFVDAKGELGQITNFNLSVGLTGEFWDAFEAGRDYPLISPLTGEEKGRVNPKKLLEKISQNTWRGGDPGVIFLDRINEANPTPDLGEIESVNPCGEQPLLPNESCNLGSVNLAKFVENGEVEWERLKEVVHVAVRFLDNVIDLNKYPDGEIETNGEIRRMTLGNRKIGLGIMGLADALIKLRLPYDSEEARGKAGEIMGFIQKEARQASIALAQERGVFPNFKGSVWEKKNLLVRNATVTTIAPTGTLSIVADCVPGCEPLYAPYYERKHTLDETGPDVESGGKIRVFNPLFLEAAKEVDFDEETLELIKEKGMITDEMVTEGKVPEWMRRVFATALQISPEDHLEMQAVLQKYTDNAVSKTVNVPFETTPEKIMEIYILAYKLGLKGVTVYRHGSRPDQIICLGCEGESWVEEEGGPVPFRQARTPRRRPSRTNGITEKLTVGCGQSIYVTINEDQGGLFEVFATMGKSGGCMASQAEAIGRMISLALRSGIETDAIIKQLEGIRCPAPAWQEGNIILSCADAIGKAIKGYVQTNSSADPKSVAASTVSKSLLGMCPECPDCGTMVEFAEGCLRCPSCGYSQCG